LHFARSNVGREIDSTAAYLKNLEESERLLDHIKLLSRKVTGSVGCTSSGSPGNLLILGFLLDLLFINQFHCGVRHMENAHASTGQNILIREVDALLWHSRLLERKTVNNSNDKDIMRSLTEAKLCMGL